MRTTRNAPVPEVKHLWEFGGGKPETACGAGSTVEFTAGVRRWLPNALKAFRVKTLLDAPCGDLNWITKTDLSDVHYVGVDADPEHVEKAKTRKWDRGTSPWSVKLEVSDVLKDVLPVSDAVLCRDFFQHLPFDDVWKALHSFSLTGAKYLFATSHSTRWNVDIPRAGMYRPLNLTLPPTFIGQPIDCVSDGNNRVLGVWRVKW